MKNQLKRKTVWQWIALISYLLALLCIGIGWITKLWVFILAPFVFYGIALWCVKFKPVRRKS